MSIRKDLLKYCKLYDGKSTKLEDNPFDKDKEEFQWYMWRHELAAVNHVTTDVDAEEYMKQEIKASIDLYAETYVGGDARMYYDIYFKS